MFTGIVEQSAPLLTSDRNASGLRLGLPRLWSDVRLGDSIAVNGVCLTVAELNEQSIGFDVVEQTLSLTNLGVLRPGDHVHVERAMQIGSRFDGHLVQGHVDGTARVIKQTQSPADWRLVGRVPTELAKYLVPRGSITLDGVSLTLAKVAGEFFEIALIPTTLQITQFAHRPVGWLMNVECDAMAKTIVAFLEHRQSAPTTTERFWE